MKQSRTYSLLIIIVLFIVFSLAGCSPSTNETISPTENPAVSVSTPETQQTETPLLSQLMAEPVEVATNPNSIRAENIDDLTFLFRYGNRYTQGPVWSPDCTQFAIAEKQIDIYDANNFTLIKTIRASDYTDMPSNNGELQFNTSSLTFTPNGKSIALLTETPINHIAIIEIDTGKLTLEPFEVEGALTLNISPDGTALYGISSIQDPNLGSFMNVYSMNLFSGSITYSFEKQLPLYSFTFSSDGAYGLSGSAGDILILWDTQTGKSIVFQDGLDAPFYFNFSSDNRYFAANDGDNVVHIWDITGNEIASLNITGQRNYIRGLAIAPEVGIAAVSNKEGKIDIFDTNSGSIIKTIHSEYSRPSLSFSPDGRFLVAQTALQGIVFWTTDEKTIADKKAAQIRNDEIKENFASLPSGGYILYSDNLGMHVISEDGSYHKDMSDSLIGVPTSADGRILTMMNWSYSKDFSGYINLLTGEYAKMEPLGILSPNLKWVVDINECNPGQYGIEAFSIKANTSFCSYVEDMNRIEKEKVAEQISRVKWSPDAGKLAFVKLTFPDLNYLLGDWSLLSSNGLYIMDTTCLRDPRTCNEKTRQAAFFPYELFTQSNLVLYLNWSPDGNLVVLNNEEVFVISDLKYEMVWKLEKTPVYLEDDYQYFGISPDNKWIAYSGDRSNIVMQPLTGGDEIEIASGMDHVQVLGWIMAPLLEINETFKVLPDGNHTRIRKFPNLELDQIGALYTSNTFTVLDGPVQEDGYTWWYIHSDADGMEGWIPEFYEWYEKVE